MSNVVTTIEQSRKLIELGLDPESADMTYLLFSDGKYSIKVEIGKRQKGESFLPAWSLSALLEVMPKVIVHDMNKHVLCLKYAEGVAPFIYYVVESGRNKGKLIRFDNGRCVPDAYDALDAAYKMVCWLLEQGLIKKGGDNA